MTPVELDVVALVAVALVTLVLAWVARRARRDADADPAEVFR